MPADLTNVGSAGIFLHFCLINDKIMKSAEYTIYIENNMTYTKTDLCF